MNARQGRKLFAGVGLISMLLGALMVVAPVGAGAAIVDPGLNPGGNDNPSCSDLGYDVQIKRDVTTGAGNNGQLSTTTSADGTDYEFIVDWTFHQDGTISFAVVTDDDDVVDLLVSAAIVKQASENSSDPGGANVYAYAPPVAADSGLVDPRGDNEFSHLTFCADIPTTPAPTPASLTVVKEITDAADDSTFPFALGEVAFGDELGHGDSDSFTLDAGTYVVSEDSGDDHTLQSIVCVDDDAAEGAAALGADDGVTVDLAGEAVSVTLADGDSVTCTFTNAPPTGSIPPPPVPVVGSLSIDKVVTGLGAPGASTQYGFEIDCTNGLKQTFTLRSDEAPKVFSNLPAGTSCEVEETQAHGASVTTYRVNGTQSATATVVANATQAVVVTNRFPAVLPGEEEPPPVVPPVTPPPGPPVVTPPVVTPPVVTPPVAVPTPRAPAPQVMGDVVTRTLPRTGNESRDLAAFGAGLLLLGAGLVLASRARYARIG